MKIYTEVVFDMNTLEEVSSKSYDYVGDVAECKGGGGGSSGKIGFPAYIESLHEDLMGGDTAWAPTVDLEAAINTAMAANPYTTINAYNPASDITAWESTATTATTNWSNLNPANDLTSYVTTARTLYNTYVYDDNYIDDQVQIYEDSAMQEAMNSVSRFAAGMADINAVNSSAYITGMANIENTNRLSVNQYRTQLTLKSKELRSQWMSQSVNMMMQMLQTKSQLGIQTANLNIDSKTKKVLAYNDQYEKDAAYDVKDAMWNINMLEYGLKALSAPGVSPSQIPPEPSQAQSALSGAMSGAAMGAAMGPMGMVAGAGIGALMSLV